jgi:hypothetical protein
MLPLIYVLSRLLLLGPASGNLLRRGRGPVASAEASANRALTIVKKYYIKEKRYAVRRLRNTFCAGELRCV